MRIKQDESNTSIATRIALLAHVSLFPTAQSATRRDGHTRTCQDHDDAVMVMICTPTVSLERMSQGGFGPTSPETAERRVGGDLTDQACGFKPSSIRHAEQAVWWVVVCLSVQLPSAPQSSSSQCEMNSTRDVVHSLSPHGSPSCQQSPESSYVYGD